MPFLPSPPYRRRARPGGLLTVLRRWRLVMLGDPVKRWGVPLSRDLTTRFGELPTKGGDARGIRKMESSVDFPFAIRRSLAVSELRLAEISDDALLVAAARGGDRAAFGELYERYARMVHGILLGRVPRDEVDDLVQDVFLQALRRLHTLRDASAFGGWLAMIARNRANDYHRSSPRSDQGGPANTELPEDLTGPSAGAPGPHAEALAALAAIRSLPDAYRETLILRLVEGMTGPEIAARTGLTPASVRVNLHRGMKQLREKLGTVPKEERS